MLKQLYKNSDDMVTTFLKLGTNPANSPFIKNPISINMYTIGRYFTIKLNAIIIAMYIPKNSVNNTIIPIV